MRSPGSRVAEKRGLLRLAVAAAVMLAAMAVAGPLASADTGDRRPESLQLTQLAFSARASNGYQLRVTAFDFPGGRPTVSATFRRSGGSVAYLTERRARLTEGRLRADLGPFGRISLRFDPLSEDDEGDCSTKERITLRGRIQVRGERRFAVARASSATGRIRIRQIGSCRTSGVDAVPSSAPVAFGGPRFPGDLERATVLAACGPEPNTQLIAVKSRGRATHYASAFERRGRIGISRTAWTKERSGSFRSARDLSSATLNPGGRFSGEGSYSTLELLTGDLAVSLPGRSSPLDLTPARAALGIGFQDLDDCPREDSD